MPKIDPAAFQDWNNGDTIQDVDYEKDREILSTAINALDDEKLNVDGDFKGTIFGKKIEDYGEAFNNARLADVEKKIADVPPLPVTLKRGENVLEAPENVALNVLEILGDEIKNVADPLDSGNWVLAPAYTVNAPNKVTLNATGGTNHVAYLIATVKPYHDYVYQVKNPGKIAVFNGAGTTAIADYAEGQSIKFNSGANTSVRIYFRNKDNENGTFIFENIMLFEGTTEREYVSGYQPVRGPYIEAANGSYLYFGEYIYKGDKIYRTANGEWRKKQNKKEVLLTLDNVKNPTINNHYVGGKGIKIPLSEVMWDADLLDQEVIKWNGTYFTRTDATTNEVNNRYYVDANSLILYFSQTDTGWQDKPADPPAGIPVPDVIPSKLEILAFLLGWKMAHNDGTVPYKEADAATKGAKIWKRIIGDTGTNGSTTLPQESYYGWKPFKIIYKTVSEQDVPAKYEGALRLSKSSNKVTLGEGIVLRESIKPVGGISDVGYLFLINYRSSTFNSWLKNKVDKFINVYRSGKYDAQWKFKTETNTQYGNGFMACSKGEYDPLAFYTVTYKVLDRFSFSCYVGNVESKGNINFHIESDDQVAQIEELRKGVSQLERVIIDSLGKPYGIPLIGKDGFPLMPDGTSVGQTRYKKFFWEVYTADGTKLHPAHLEAPDKPNKYTKNIPLDGIVPKKINIYFSRTSVKQTTPTVIERVNGRRQDHTYVYYIDVEEWLTTGRVWIEDRMSADNTRKYYVQFNKNISPKDYIDAPGHGHTQQYGTYINLTKFYNVDPLFSNLSLEFTNTVGNTVNAASDLFVQVEVEVWGI